MEIEIVELASTTPFLVLNAICLILSGAAALTACNAQRRREARLVTMPLPSQDMALKPAA
jgi:hypothetical protein